MSVSTDSVVSASSSETTAFVSSKSISLAFSASSSSLDLRPLKPSDSTTRVASMLLSAREDLENSMLGDVVY